MNNTVQPISAEQIWQLNRFYKRNGHKGKANEEDICWGLYQDEQLYAGVRLSLIESGYLLRGLWVAKGKRGEGLGSSLLHAVCAQYNTQPIWCYPFNHLRDFYCRAGFQYADDKSPAPLQQKLARYLSRGEDVCLMVRK